jgi:Spy/CpxP family protein refolding chaperone
MRPEKLARSFFSLLASLFVTVLLASLGTPPARARAGPEPVAASSGSRRPGGVLLNAPMERLAPQLGLTEPQRSEIEAIRNAYIEKTQDDVTAARRLRDDLHEMWTSGEVPNKRAVMKLHEEMQTHRARLMDHMVDAKLQAVEVLEPRQRKRLSSGVRRGRGGRGPSGRR